MTLPANIRVNVGAPFPALVKAAAPMTLSKANGIFTLGFSFALLNIQSPAPVNLPTDYVLVWDSIAKTFFAASLSSIGAARPQRLVTAGPVAFLGGDQILNLKLTASYASTLPSYAVRSGVPLTLCDVTKLYGLAFYEQTFDAAAGETIDGEASVSITQPGQSITLLPMNDGLSEGWKQI